MKYYIIAGEASGDLHGSNLMKGLKEADKNASFRVWGGDLMAAQGGELVRHYKETAVMGFVEVISSLGKIRDNLHLCKKDILEYNPHIVILIDYPGFNFRIARFAKKNNFRVFYYISPKVWAWNEGRVKNLKRDIDALFIIFPFEIDYFKNHNIRAIYNGNPLLDSVAQHKYASEDREEFCTRTGVGSEPYIALLAGSRMSEINYLMPRMVKLSKLLPKERFILAGAPSIERSIYDKWIDGTSIKLLTGETYSLLKHCKSTVLASGTASLEAALLNAPQVVCYGGNEISYQIAKRLVKVKYISLVNLILDQPLVKELIQHSCTPENMAKELLALQNEKHRARVLQKYDKIREMLGGEGASVKVAKAMVEEYTSLRDAQRYYKTIDTPLGVLKLVSNNDFLLEIRSLKENESSDDSNEIPQIIIDAERELKEYFENRREEFSIPIKPIGTDFQIKIWDELRRIPFGKIKSYGEIAKIVGDKDASRAVGNACKMNPLLIVIPCHRVLGAQNKLTGFNIGVEKKSFLLEHEKAYLKDEANLFSQNKTEENEN